MTVKNAVESIMLAFPQLPEPLVLMYLDNAQKDFSRETNILTARAELSSIDANFAWVLPSDFIEFKDLKAYDSDGNAYEIKDQNLKFEIEFGKLYAKSTSGVPLTAIPDAINKIYLHYVKSPSSITSISSSFGVDEDLQMGVIARVYQILYGSIPTDVEVRDGVAKILNLNAAKYWEGQYIEKRREGKRKANSKNYVKGEVQFYDQAGVFTLPQRSNDVTVSSTTVPALVGAALIYDKYAMLTVVEGEATGTLIGQFGFTGTISATISGNTITVSSTSADFVQGTLRIEHANEYIGYVVTNTSTLTFTAETGWVRDTITLIVDKT